jgi:hypothetical protein
MSTSIEDMKRTGRRPSEDVHNTSEGVEVDEELKVKHGGSSSDLSSQGGYDNLAALTDVDQKRHVKESKVLSKFQSLAEFLSRFNIEGIGITPLTLEQRKGTQWWSPGILWFSANVNGEWQVRVGAPFNAWY